MTVRAKPIGSRSSRPSRMDDGRRNMLITAAFGGVVVIAILILIGAIAIGWYSDNYGEVAKVNGATIDRSEFRDRYRVELFRIDLALRRLRDDLQAGRISEADHDSQAALLQQQREDTALQQSVLARLIDQELEGQLAATEGVTVSEADIDAKVADDATRPEMRHAWLIAVDPQILAATGEPTDADRAEARQTLEKALADITGGKTWQEVAKVTSTDASALQEGDLGYVSGADEMLDPAFQEAIFAAAPDTPTAIVEGQDGVFRAGLVTDVAASYTEPDFEQQLTEAEIPLAAYRATAAADLIRQRLEEKIVTGVIDAESPQRRASEIYIADAPEKVRVRHILFSPKDDPQGALDLDADDPAWAAAEEEATALRTQLASVTGGEDKLLAAFEEAAKNSDEDGADETGGLLPFLTQDELDTDFGAAVFAPGLKKNQLLEPIRSSFGWHVVLFDERQAPGSERIEEARQRALAPLASFATVAQATSEGPEAVDGGDLGWIARGQLTPTEREDAIFAAPIGSVSNVLTIPEQGFYIFRVAEEANRKPDARQVETLRTSAYSNWYEARREEADISIGSAGQVPFA